MTFKPSDIPDLARKGYKPRVVNGVVTTLVEPPNDYVPVKEKSLKEELADSKVKAAEIEAKADANAAEIEKIKPKPVK